MNLQVAVYNPPADDFPKLVIVFGPDKNILTTIKVPTDVNVDEFLKSVIQDIRIKFKDFHI